MPDATQFREQISALGPWFHNLRIGQEQTAPDHFLGDYPQVKWERIRSCLPENLAGKTVLDIGCNAGFYSLEMKRRGAARVLGIDSDEHYLRQARWAAEVNEIDVEFRRLSVYEVDLIEESFDLVIFMGVFYHLRYPLYALDKVVRTVRGQMVFQTMLRPFPDGVEAAPIAPEYSFAQRDVFREPEMPRMHFIERTYAGDPTNAWIPNQAAMEAMLRSAGLRIAAHPEQETWICEPVDVWRAGETRRDFELSGRVWLPDGFTPTDDSPTGSTPAAQPDAATSRNASGGGHG